MREESQLDEMRAAIRGDFERLERRLGIQELMHLRDRAPETNGPTDVPAAEAGERGATPRPSWRARLSAALQPRQV